MATKEDDKTPVVEFKNPLHFTVPDGKGGEKTITLDGDDQIPVSRDLIARAANNLEASHQRGMFQALSVSEAHVILGGIVALKALALSSVDGKKG